MCKQIELKRLETRPDSVQLERGWYHIRAIFRSERGSRKSVDLTVRLLLREAIYSAVPPTLIVFTIGPAVRPAAEIERERSGLRYRYRNEAVATGTQNRKVHGCR
mgnify:CR=1 FL=1